MRQVPDTQEVFLYPDSGISIIVEVLQSVDANAYTDIARWISSLLNSLAHIDSLPPRYHFDSLAHDNDAGSTTVLDIYRLPGDSTSQTPAPTILSGTQLVRKFNSTHPDEIRILLAVYRIQDHNIDLVMTMNVPMKTSDDGAVSENEWQTSKRVFDVAAQSLRIVDFGLFAS